VKNRLFITLTDVKGSRQFTMLRPHLYRVLFIFLLTLLSLILYPIWLKEHNNQLLFSNNALLEQQHQIKQQTEALHVRHQQLSEQLEQQTATLALNQQQYQHLVKQIHFSDSDILATADRFDVLANQVAFRKMLLQIMPNGRPVRYDRVTSSFGHRFHPFLKKRYLHKGIDVHSRLGTPVVATADGLVTNVQKSVGGFGKLIKVTHPMGFTTYYGHLKTIGVNTNQVVRKGEVIGYSGNTGRSTGPHLHYEVRFGNVAHDPANFILLTLNNFDQQLEKIEDIPWASLMDNMQRVMAIKPLLSSPKIVTSPVNLILTAACTSTVGCQATSIAKAPLPSAGQGMLMAK
jgi:murein DD-endopeptidase MepM/ murein hydrolase activator NlpD